MARKNKLYNCILISLLLPALCACSRGDFAYPESGTQPAQTGEIPDAPISAEDTTQPQSSGTPDNSTAPLIVATTSDYPPFEFMHNGELAGLDIELINYIGKRTGRDIQLRDMGQDFDGALKAVAGGSADIAVAAIQPTPERAEDMAFSEPYYIAGGQCILVRKEHADVITDRQALDGAAVACMNGDVAMALLGEAVPNAEIIRTESETDAVNLLLAGEVDAAAVSEVVGRIYCAKYADRLHMADIDIGETQAEGVCVAVKKGDDALLADINAAIEDAKRLELIGRWMDNAIGQAAELPEI